MNTHDLLQSLTTGKLPRNLRWDAVIELIGKIGAVEAQGAGDNEFAFVVGSQRAFFKRPSGHDLDVEEVSRLRTFLLEAGPIGPAVTKAIQPGRMVVVIDHHAAHLYQDLGGSRPQNEHTLKPHDPDGFHRHLIHKKEAHYQGQRVPEDTSFYEEIAKALVPAQEIVLIGH